MKPTSSVLEMKKPSYCEKGDHCSKFDDKIPQKDLLGYADRPRSTADCNRPFEGP